MSRFDYFGQPRFVCGRARYPQPPEPGTIVGPKDTTKEWLVVLGQDGGVWTLFGYATASDLEAANARLVQGDGPRSPMEARMSALLARAAATTGGAR